MRLTHLHIPRQVPFTHVSRIQQSLVSRLLEHKKNPSSLSPPDPTVITFTPHPVYTTGRRDLPPSVVPSASARATAVDPKRLSPLSSDSYLPEPLEPIRGILTADPPLAEYAPTLRGGQTTYHGPGQLVIYTVLDLRRLNLTPRCHIRLLENSVIDLLRSYHVNGTVTEDPGVWVPNNNKEPADVRKIAAVGVHLRRHVSSYGVGLNVTNEPLWFLQQIVACGLEGKEATSLQAQGADVRHGDPEIMEQVAGRFVDRFVERWRQQFGPGSQRCEGTAGGQRTTQDIDSVHSIEEADALD